MKILNWIKNNYWRFTPDSWVDWFYYIKGNIAFKIHSWWYWYSPFWKKTRRCPFCAGSGKMVKYEVVYDCYDCRSTGEVPKYYKWYNFVDRS